jgi:cytochrome c-type biogenesis protein CcmH/NrfG
MSEQAADIKAISPVLPDSRPADIAGSAAGLTLTTRLAGAMILLVAAAVFAVGWLSYRSLEQALIPRVLERIETHSRFVAADLESHLRSAPGDITTFANLEAVAGLVRSPQRRH